MLRLFPLAALLLLVVPVMAGLFGVALPAFGYLPVLGSDTFSLAPFRDLLAMPGLARSAFLSFSVGLATTALSFAVVVLFVAGWRGTRVFQAVERLVSPLLSVPHAATAFGLAFLIAPSGLLFRLAAPLLGFERPPDLLIVHDRNALAMTLGLVVKEIPFLFLMTLSALPQTRAGEMERMIRALGYGRVRGFLHAILPSLYRQIRFPVLAVLAFATSVIDVALILGPTTPAPLAVRILDWQGDPDLGMRFVAAAGALLQVAVTVAALVAWLVLERVVIGLWRRIAGSGRRERGDAWLRGGSLTLMALAAGTVLGGIVLLGAWSVAASWRYPEILPHGLTFATWTRFGGDIRLPLRDTLALAATSSLLATVLAVGTLESAARRGRRESALQALYVPLIVPQVAFLFGLEILFTLARIDGTFTAVLLVHLLFVFPYVLLSLSEPWRDWDPRYGLAIRALGHGANAVFWRVRLPMLARPVMTAAALGFAVSVALYLPTLMIGGGRWPTLTTETVALASGGDPRLIGATALAQALLPFLGFGIAAILPAILFRNRRRMRGEA